MGRTESVAEELVYKIKPIIMGYVNMPTEWLSEEFVLRGVDVDKKKAYLLRKSNQHVITLELETFHYTMYCVNPDEY